MPRGDTLLPKTSTWIVGLCVANLLCSFVRAEDQQLAVGRRAITGRAGCFLVDYSFVETEALKPGYNKDNRVYDVNREKSVKEWIFTEELSPTRIKLQHVLFATDLKGKVMEDSTLKHTGEDWEYNAPHLYDFAVASTWKPRSLQATPNVWTRRVNSLDDGPRYQCAAAWNLTTAYADWSCENYAPIPGRETRDMGRKDYQALQRTSRIIVYDRNWLERERNVKTIDQNGNRTPLAKEVGKTWYVRLPDTECSGAQAFVKPRLAFWLLTQQAWDRVLSGDRPFVETPPGQPSRYEQILDLEEKYLKRDLPDPAVKKEAQAEIERVIAAHRQP